MYLGTNYFILGLGTELSIMGFFGKYEQIHNFQQVSSINTKQKTQD